MTSTHADPTWVRSPPGPRLLLSLCAIGWAALGTWLLTSSQVPTGSVTPAPWLAHAAIFFGLTATAWTLLQRSNKALTLLVLGLAVFAIATELVQALWLNTRSGDFWDVAADLAGVAFGAAVVIGLFKLFPSWNRLPQLIAFASAAALMVLTAAILAAHPWTVHRWTCRGAPAAISSAQQGQPEPAVTIDTGPLAQSTAAEPIIVEDFRSYLCRVMETDQLTVIVGFTSANTSQDGPTRLLTSSIGGESNDVNFHLGQTGPHLSVRVREGGGQGFTGTIVEDVITPGREQTMALRVLDGTASVWMAGLKIAEFDVSGDDLNNWRPSYPLIVGDEYDGGRRFEGLIKSVEFYDVALADDALRSLAS